MSATTIDSGRIIWRDEATAKAMTSQAREPIAAPPVKRRRQPGKTDQQQAEVPVYEATVPTLGEFLYPCQRCRTLGYVPRRGADRIKNQTDSDPCKACRQTGWYGIDPALPTTFGIGSLGRMAIYQMRRTLGLPMFVAGDAMTHAGGGVGGNHPHSSGFDWVIRTRREVAEGKTESIPPIRVPKPREVQAGDWDLCLLSQEIAAGNRLSPEDYEDLDEDFD